MKIASSRSLHTLLISTVVAATFAGSAMAQVAPTNDPSLIQRRFQQPVQPPKVTAPIIQQPAIEEPAIAGAESVQFQLNDVSFIGATAYPEKVLKQEFASLIGQQVSLADVQSAVTNITRKYRQDGYVLSRAILPAQQMSDGIVRVQILEGYVAKVTVEGEESKRKLINKYMKKIENIRPLKIETLERYLLLSNDLPGVEAKAVVRPAQDALGGAEVIVTVEQDKFEGSFGVDNRGTKYMGPIQFTTILTGNNLAGIYDRTTFRNITTSDTDEMRFFDLQHEEQLGSEGTKLRLIASRVDSKPGSSLEVLDIDGESTDFVAAIYQPYLRTRAQNITFRGMFDYRQSETSILDVDLFRDRVRSLRIGGAYDFVDRINGVNLFDAQLSQGMNIFNPTDPGSDQTRADARPEYTKVEGTVSRRQDLPWNLSWVASATGQYAFQPVAASEEFALGGLGFGQAYDPSELTGDHGAAFHTELQYGGFPGYRYFDSYQAYVYYDLGAVWQEESYLTDADRASLASAGIGLRFNLNQAVSGSTEIGIPLTKNHSSNGDDNARVYFGLTGRF